MRSSPLSCIWSAALALALGVLQGACADGAGRPPAVDVPPIRDGADAPPADTADVPPADASPADVAPDVLPRCATDLQCEDGVACTEDRCVNGACASEPVAARCGAGSACDVRRGCLPPRPCAVDGDCADGDPCTVDDRCDAARRVCVFGELPAGTACGGGRACRGGRCACPPTRPLACGAACVAPESDPDHCGGCAAACGAGAWCRDGRCRCSAPQTYCPGVGCVDVTADPAHCGACGRACPASDAGPVTCASGECVLPCATGTHRCGARCVPDDAVASCGRSCEPCPAPANGRAVCFPAGCGIACDPGYHVCGSTCASDASVLTCGTACAPCGVPENGAVACVAGLCRVTCATGFHFCGGRCLDDTSVASCGTACAPCGAPEHGVPVCAAGRCDFTCEAPFRRCGDSCSDGTSPLGCGPGCVRCPAPDNGVATCAAGACGVRCDAGHHACGERCPSDASPLSCGTSCAPCPVPENGAATCAAGACGIACDPGFAPAGGTCLEVPRPVWPPAAAYVGTARPALRWRLPAGATEARVELCRERACASVAATLTAAGTTARPAEDLAPGVYFWRVRSHDGARTGPTWSFVVGRRGGAADTSWGVLPDVNNDGRGDVLAGVPFLAVPGARVYAHHGTATGVNATPDATLDAPDAEGNFGFAVAAVGDVNGDGFGDVLVGSPNVRRSEGAAYLFRGSAAGLRPDVAAELRAPDPDGSFGQALAAAGDVNGDGYGDVVVGAPRARGQGRAYVYLGGARGLATTPAATLTGDGVTNGRLGISVAAAGDVDGDGFGEVLVGADGVASFTGRAYLYRGSAAGLGATAALTLARATGGQFGVAVAGAGDVDGDGHPDVVVGAQGVDGGTGQVSLYRGSAAGLASAPASTLTGPAGPGGDFGATLAPAGDVDGDGFGDVTVGAPRTDMFRGEAYVFRGSAAGLGAAPAATLRGTGAASALAGGAVAAGRDVDGDGYADVVVSAEREGMFVGRVYVYRGSAAGVGATPITLSGPDAVFGRYGFSVARRVAPRACFPRG